MKAKKMNSYIRLLLIMILAAFAGGVLGLGFFVLYDGTGGGIERTFTALMEQGQSLIFPLLCVIMALSVISGEWSLWKLRYICEQVMQYEDEDCDRWEYEEEKIGAIGLNANILSQVFCFVVLSLGYSIKYIGSGNHISFLYACGVFIICLIYDAFWQIRYVKLIQKTHPEKKGDPCSKKFRQQWFESCDEAEKEVVCQSAYKAYIAINRSVPVLLLVTMLLHLFFDTGILAIIVVAVIWIVTSITYTHSCVKMRERKIGSHE